jgi:hypothetical protein
MSISYPFTQQSAGSGGSSSPRYFPATVGITFPVTVSGTNPTLLGTMVIPSAEVYGITEPSTYYYTAIVNVASASNATASIVIGGTSSNEMWNYVEASYYSNQQFFGTLALHNSYKFQYSSSQSGIGDDIIRLAHPEGTSGAYPPLSLPIYASCSSAEVTCSISLIQFSYKGIN